MKNYLFAKFFQSLSMEQLMETCASLSIDGPTLLIRDGYWVTSDNLHTTLPGFVRLAKEYGLQVEYADTPFGMNEMDKLDSELELLAENGVKMFRVSYVPKTAAPARELADLLKRYAAGAAAAAERHGLRAVVQLHGVFYPHNATAAWPMVKDLDPRYIGIKMDPGNNLAQEGYELFDYQVALLGEYLAAIGEKDAGLFRTGSKAADGKGWERRFVPAQEGIADYDFIFREIRKNGQTPVGILMPFYHENEPEKMLAAFREEIAYFKRCQKEAGLA